MEGSVLGALIAVLVFGVFQLCGISLSRLAFPRESDGIRLLLGQWDAPMVSGAFCLFL